jgi:RNA polymerase sigma factor (sigma-70 family)
MRAFSSGGASLDDLERLYREEGAAFERVSVAITGDDQLGCDAMHDAFVRAVRDRQSFNGSGPLVAWLWQIVLNEARRRRRNVVDLADLTEADAVTPSDEDMIEDGAFVRSRIAQLPEREKLVLFLRYYADLDYSCIASALEIAPGTVGAALNHAHKRLLHDLQEVRE